MLHVFADQMNASTDQFSLVYHTPVKRSTQSSMSDSIWPAAAHQSPSSPFSPPPFAVPNRPQDHSNFSSPSSPFVPHGSPPEFSSPSDTHTPDSDSTFTQMEPSIGPTRVQSRRQRTSHGSPLRLSPKSEDVSTSDEAQGSPERSSIYFLPSSRSRPSSPVSAAQLSQSQTMPERLTLSMSTSPIAVSLRSPGYPSSPASPSSIYSPYAFHYAPHSKSNSDSPTSGSHPRHASPSLSASSTPTTDSSSGSAPNPTQHLSVLPQTIGNLAPITERQKQRKQRLFNVDRKAICIYHMQYPNARQEDIAQRYGVERSTISKILKHKTKWMNVPEAENLRVAKHRPSKFPEVEEDLLKWLVEATQHGIQLTDASIRAQAKLAAQKLNIGDDKFKASSGWIENFKHRHGIRKGKWHGAVKEPRIPRLGSLVPVRREADVLPQLNTAFTRTDRTDDREYNGLEQATTSSPGSDGFRRGLSDLSSSPMSLHSPWPRSPESPGNSPLMSHSTDSVIRDSLNHQPLHHPHHVQLPAPPTLHLDVSHPRPHSHTHSPDSDSPPGLMHFTNGYDHPVVGPETSMEAYHPVSPISPGSITLAEAVVAVDKLIAYVEAQPPPFISDQARDSLAHVKFALYNAGNGVAYERS